MEILREKLKADKKLLVATNMELTESEAKTFWPVYEEYQKELQRINQRLLKLLNDYAADYKTNSVSDEKAKKLTDEYVSLQQAEANLTTSFVPKLNKALPPKKVARYLQIENKIRAVIKYDLASTVPLVPVGGRVLGTNPEDHSAQSAHANNQRLLCDVSVFRR